MRPRRRPMGRQPVVDSFVRGASTADVKHDVHDQEAEQDRQSRDQDEPCEHRREEDKHRMPIAYAGRDAFDAAVSRGSSTGTSSREDGAASGDIGSLKRCGHATAFARKTRRETKLTSVTRAHATIGSHSGRGNCGLRGLPRCLALSARRSRLTGARQWPQPEPRAIRRRAILADGAFSRRGSIRLQQQVSLSRWH